MKKQQRILAAALALGMAAAMAGCGASAGTGSAAAPSENAASAAAAVGAAAQPAAVEGTEVYNADGLRITATELEVEPGRDKLHLYLENLTDKNAIRVEWLELALDGEPYSKEGDQGWFPDEWWHTIDPGDNYSEKVFIDNAVQSEVLAGCTEINLTVAIQNPADAEAAQTVLTIPVAELTTTAAEGSDTQALPWVRVAEQELYNENGLRVSTEEQILWDSGAAGGRDNVEFIVENSRDMPLGIDISSVSLNGEPLYEADLSDWIFEQVDEGSDSVYIVHLEESGLSTLKNSTADANEITVTLYVTDVFRESEENVTFTIPVEVNPPA